MLNFLRILTILIVCNLSVFGYEYDASTLELVHVVFRHGNRTIDRVSQYPTDPHINETYYPYGYGQLTNGGRLREYRLGKALRKRYDRFLGDVYTPTILDAVSTEVNRTKMSLELVLAGLFPPRGTLLEWEKELNWQPIPYNYLKFAEDHILSWAQNYCRNYITLYEEYLRSPPGMRVLNRHRKLFKYINDNTGLNVTTPFDVFLLNAGLIAEEEWGLKLPEWTEVVYPKYIEEAVIDHYILGSATPELKQLSGGFLLKKIITDTFDKITGSLVPPDRKIFLYSAHDFTISYLLNALEVFFKHSPPYGACILVELHRIHDVYGIMLFYENYTRDQPRRLKVPGCGYFCPLDEFVSLLEKNLPVDDNACDSNVYWSK
ncbi:hypothetical protein ILUMI_23492 [Ignelater luminosus]|uniref:acid phosphatase n=1 Tax=Ignelater luminosus TaxID=2038154 RepID=A0A8K0FWX1_IGNLU|nr:hypothetical protein ILUMI_23492 [Ignelater luminosus]